VTKPRVRRATAADEARLREVAAASKGYWGYDQERVREWAASADLLREIWVAERGGRIVAWGAVLPPDDGRCVLDDLWVEPEAIRTGVGTVLFEHAVARAHELGARSLRWESDPNAVGFYERMGAATVGTAIGPWGRECPVMEIAV
jgi:GNAT superfamily N-acetyltransferase